MMKLVGAFSRSPKQLKQFFKNIWKEAYNSANQKEIGKFNSNLGSATSKFINKKLAFKTVVGRKVKNSPWQMVCFGRSNGRSIIEDGWEVWVDVWGMEQISGK